MFKYPSLKLVFSNDCIAAFTFTTPTKLQIINPQQHLTVALSTTYQ